ncbi:immunoglobulin-like domain-containing protein [Domibacillus aminovorans]|uniref:immunoglobulin-like domain-containing protein n=1 Tax=Domibacillus aminovorans TaxID=29332 RepID=UPI0039F54840
MFFTNEGHLFAPNETASETISFEIFSEKLSAGNYRIIKDFRDYEKEYSSENQVNIAAPFKLIEP